MKTIFKLILILGLPSFEAAWADTLENDQQVAYWAQQYRAASIPKAGDSSIVGKPYECIIFDGNPNRFSEGKKYSLTLHSFDGFLRYDIRTSVLSFIYTEKGLFAIHGESAANGTEYKKSWYLRMGSDKKLLIQRTLRLGSQVTDESREYHQKRSQALEPFALDEKLEDFVVCIPSVQN